MPKKMEIDEEKEKKKLNVDRVKCDGTWGRGAKELSTSERVFRRPQVSQQSLIEKYVKSSKPASQNLMESDGLRKRIYNSRGCFEKAFAQRTFIRIVVAFVELKRNQ